MDGVDEFTIGKPLGHDPDRSAHVFNSFPKILAAVGGDQDHSPIAEHGILLLPPIGAGPFALDRPKQSVDDRVAGNADIFGRGAFGQQGVGGPLGRRTTKRGG